MSTSTPIRDIPPGLAACTVCDELIPLAYSKAKVGRDVPLFVHGPRTARCPGGEKPGRSWIEATGLPTWDAMSDLDKGAALLFVWKVHWEQSYSYARENYPCRYLDDPALVALDEFTACRHASAATGRYAAIYAQLGAAEFDRLYNLALDAESEARRG